MNYQLLGDWTLIHTTSSVECHGVSHLYNKRIAPLVIDIDGKSDRIIATHINGNPKLCIISEYAQTETFSSEAKDSFYEDLKELIFDIPPHTVLIAVLIIFTQDSVRLGKENHETNPDCRSLLLL